MEHKAYLHRSGRTARAGAQGDVITLCLPTQRKDLADLLRKADIAVTPQSVSATSPQVLALIGEVSPCVKPVPQEHKHHGGGGTSQGRNAQRKRAVRSGDSPTGANRGGRPGRNPRPAQPGRDQGLRPASAARRPQERSR